MITGRRYSPASEPDQGGMSETDKETILHEEGPHQPGDTSLDDQEELPGGYIHGHVDQGSEEE